MTGATAPEPQTLEEDTLRDDEFPTGRRGTEAEVASEEPPVVVPDPRSEVVPAPGAGTPPERDPATGPAAEDTDDEDEAASSDPESPSTPPMSENRKRAERTAPLFAELATLEKDDPRRERLREILATHPGVSEVHLKLTQPGRATVMRLEESLRIDRSPSLFGDLKALLGPGCLAS